MTSFGEGNQRSSSFGHPKKDSILGSNQNRILRRMSDQREINQNNNSKAALWFYPLVVPHPPPHLPSSSSLQVHLVPGTRFVFLMAWMNCVGRLSVQCHRASATSNECWTAEEKEEDEKRQLATWLVFRAVFVVGGQLRVRFNEMSTGRDDGDSLILHPLHL